jgi:hypothetical protein
MTGFFWYGGGPEAQLLGGAQAFELDAEPGNYAVTGAVAGLVAGFVLAAEVGAYSLTGAPATFALEQPSDPGSYAVSGVVAGLVANYAENGAPGSYVVTGQLATVAIEFPGAFGVYAQTGFEADLEYTPLGPTEFPLDAEPGAYSLSGVVAGLVASYAFSADPGSYAVSGVPAGLVVGYVLGATPGTYLVVGADAEFVHLAGGQFELDAAAGAYLVTGFADGAVIVQPVTGEVSYDVIQNGRRRTIVVRTGGKRREV